ncbi:MAG: isoprenylcysteine carboxylmethyltransferase family protein [Candidatus Zixiibacteriota bacterium]|nr:MAG: isoprenylcysteine carboxylmethyltransferase family protein [candidate division Zixibacteria bacterium]
MDVISPVERPQAEARGSVVRTGLVRMTSGVAVNAALLFLAAGTLDWPAAWVLLGLQTAAILFNLVMLSAHNPGLIASRTRFTRGSPAWDRAIDLLMTAGFLGTYLAAGLARRFETGAIPDPVAPVVGAGLTVAGYALFAWAMHTNRFFTRMVRIQTERGHTVVDGGPYRFVRHPGYVGVIAYTLGAALLLGYAWALIPAGLGAAAVMARTAKEDRFLHRELDGYAEYAARVRRRLAPGVW